MNEFWMSFWSNLLSNIALLIFLSVAGYLAKARIVVVLKKFIGDQVDTAIQKVEDQEQEHKK
jgi:hypothetical protein